MLNLKPAEMLNLRKIIYPVEIIPSGEKNIHCGQWVPLSELSTLMPSAAALAANFLLSKKTLAAAKAFFQKFPSTATSFCKDT